MSYFKIVNLLILFLFVSCADNEEIKISTSTITESVYASGVVKAQNQHVIYPLVSGVLKSIEVEVGQSVSENQVLFKIENEKAALSTDNARLMYELNQENSGFIQDKIAEMETRVQSAKDKMDLDASVLKRNQKASEYGGISEVELERVELVYNNSKSSYEATVKQLEQLKAQLKNEQSRNAINLKINQKSEEDYSVKSAFSGKLFDVLVKPGALVSPQTALGILGEQNSYILELDVDENDIIKIALGQKIMVSLDSYKNEVFEAEVNKIYPIMNERSRTFRIEAHFVSPPQKLYPNLTVEANIIIQTKEDVIVIPKNYLADQDHVLIKKNEKRKIKTGLNNYEMIEVLEGLKVGETIYKPN